MIMVRIPSREKGLYLQGADEGFNLPEWYRIEQESKKAIERLHNIKELEFYSENPDPFIRRLAIMRAGALGSKEAFSMLNNVMEDPLESEHNRMLAGAFMQKLNESLGMTYYIQNRYMQSNQVEAAGSGKFILPVIDSQPALRYEFSKTLIESQLQLDQSIIKINLDDREFAFPFRLGNWLIHLGSAFAVNTIRCLKKVVTLVWAILAGMSRAIFIGLPGAIIRSIRANCAAKKDRADVKEQTAHIENGETLGTGGQVPCPNRMAPGTRDLSPCPKPVRYKRSKTYHIPVYARGGMLMRWLMSALFRPFRFAFRHKTIVFGSLLVIYLLVSLSTPGKTFFSSITPRLYEENDRFIQSMGRYIMNTFQGTLSPEPPAPLDEATPVPQKAAVQYVVTAPKGLYLRDKPSEDGEKIRLMKLSTTVEYLDEKIEGKDVVWVKIRLDDGTSGWSNAAWLKEVTDG